MTVSVDLPVGSAGTPGAAATVSNLSEDKILSVIGDAGLEVDIEFTPDGTNWFRLRKILAAGKYKFSVACASLRASIPAGVATAPTNIDVSADDGGTAQVAIAIPSADGDTGASVDVSALGDFSTLTAAGLVSGEVIYEASEDDVDFLPCFSVDAAAPFRSGEIATNFLRARREGGGGESITGALFSANNPLTSGSSSFAQAIETYILTSTAADADGIKVFADTDFRACCNAMAAIPGPKDLCMDSSGGNIQITDDALGPYPMGDVTICGLERNSEVSSDVDIQTGVVFTHFANLAGNVSINWYSTGPALVSDLGGSGNPDQFDMGWQGGGFPTITGRTGSGVMFDMSSAGGGNTSFNMRGRISSFETTTLIDFGTMTGRCTFNMYDLAELRGAGIVGAPAGIGTVQYRPAGTPINFAYQTINFSGTHDFTNSGKDHTRIEPLPPLAAATAGFVPEISSLGRYDTTAGDITEELPEIVVSSGSRAGRTTVGQAVIIYNEVGGNDVIVTGDTGLGDTIGGVAPATPVRVPPGVAMTFRSDGVDNWSPDGTAYRPAAAYDQTAYSTASRVHAARTAADPGAITDYVPPATGGGVTVTSIAATDLDTANAAIALLEDEVTALRAEFVKLRADTLNSNELLNSLIDDSQAQGGSI